MHLGIIPDGGRRWARRQGVSLREAYETTFEKLGSAIELAFAAQFDELSIYLLSKGNLARPADDLDALYAALPRLDQILTDALNAGVCRGVHVAGRPEQLPIAGVFSRCTNLVPDRPLGPSLNLLLAYDAIDELNAAFRTGGPDTWRDFLWVRSPLDAVIRTGGAPLFSGFLPLQSQYAHLLVVEELFNDVDDRALEALIVRARSVEHRFGL